MTDAPEALSAQQAHAAAFKVLSEPLSLSIDKWLGPLVPNPSRRWWQFWKPKMVRQPPKTWKATGGTIKFRRPPPFEVREDRDDQEWAG